MWSLIIKGNDDDLVDFFWRILSIEKGNELIVDILNINDNNLVVIGNEDDDDDDWLVNWEII